MFVDRERELEALETRYRSEQAEFAIVTGRRRVGKTTLLAAFANGKQRALRPATCFSSRIATISWATSDARFSIATASSITSLTCCCAKSSASPDSTPHCYAPSLPATIA